VPVAAPWEARTHGPPGRTGEAILARMAQLAQSRAFEIDAAPLAAIRAEFDAFSVGEAQTAEEIARLWREARYLADPHTAVGIGAARREADLRGDRTPLVVLGTAHAAKFPDAIEAATGKRPALPPHLEGLYEKPEHFSLLPNDQGEIERFIRDAVLGRTSRAAS
jgi:threonine synthase